MKLDTAIILLTYLIGLVLIIIFRKDEFAILAILSTVLLIVFCLYKTHWTAVIILTIVFTLVENLCVYYGLWQYNNTKYPMPYVPLWLYLAWLLSIIFIIKIHDKIKLGL